MLADLGRLAEELDPAGAVDEVEEDELAHVAAGHDPAGEAAHLLRSRRPARAASASARTAATSSRSGKRFGRLAIGVASASGLGRLGKKALRPASYRPDRSSEREAPPMMKRIIRKKLFKPTLIAFATALFIVFPTAASAMPIDPTPATPSTAGPTSFRPQLRPTAGTRPRSHGDSVLHRRLVQRRRQADGVLDADGRHADLNEQLPLPQHRDCARVRDPAHRPPRDGGREDPARPAHPGPPVTPPVRRLPRYGPVASAAGPTGGPGISNPFCRPSSNEPLRELFELRAIHSDRRVDGDAVPGLIETVDPEDRAGCRPPSQSAASRTARSPARPARDVAGDEAVADLDAAAVGTHSQARRTNLEQHDRGNCNRNTAQMPASASTRVTRIPPKNTPPTMPS